MANPNRPFGFRPVQSRDVNGYTGKTRAVIVSKSDVSSFFIGDMVIFTGNSIKRGDKYYETVTKAVGGAAQAAENLAGAITGIKSYLDSTLLYTGYIPTGATQEDIIIEIPQDRNTVYEVQEDSVGGALTAADTGLNINFNPGTGDPATRMSGATIDSSTAATTATHQLRLMAPDGAIGNDVGDYAKWYVSINTDYYSDKTGV